MDKPSRTNGKHMEKVARLRMKQKNFEGELYEYSDFEIIQHRHTEYLRGLSDARKYVERRGYGEQDYW